ncbi:unnamed protein product [Microthlaspi erraticum]|uniref:F-box associated beta-propeller type 1 domain-containing protein n=1 Tax=Microthlaspi erraticum TaxID=1685480 RepID=A0A6D2HP52_9BRAS|nr:unnamed protein product [Microthlaspi erraticum]
MWNALSKKRILGGKSAKKQFLGFMMMDSRVCSIQFDLQGIRNDEEDFVGPCIKQVSLLEQVEISRAFHCDGLLLCVLKDSSRLVLWNPYLGQIRWIQPRNSFHRLDRYPLGYDENRNHKILRVFGEYESSRSQVSGYEIYDLSSDSWKVFDFDVSPDWDIQSHQRGVSLKGNAFFLAHEKTRKEFVSLSCVREEQLAVLYQNWEDLEIQVTKKIDPYTVSWSEFLRPISGCQINNTAGSFFIDEEKKVAVVFELDRHKQTEDACRYQTAYIIEQDGYLRAVNIGVAPNLRTSDKCGYTSGVYCRPLVCSSSYAPSLVQLQIKKPSKSDESND